MKAGALLALALVCGTATAQDGFYCGTVFGPYFDSKIEATFFATDRNVTIVTFTTTDRADFYELLLRAGRLADWEYEVDWDPKYRLKVFVMPDDEGRWTMDHGMQLRRILVHLNMTYRITGGRYEIVFRGEKSTVLPPEISSEGGELDYTAWDAPSMLVIAALAESQRLSYRVDGVNSEMIDVTLVGARLNDAFYALEAQLDWKIKRGPRGLIVRRRNKTGL